MHTAHFTYLLIAALITIIGALPFGLVNLTVVNVTLKNGYHPAIKIANGAALIEVLFGITAILAGGVIKTYIQNLPVIHFIIIGIIIGAGLFFMFSNKNTSISEKNVNNGFIKGVFLNLISIQVLLYWIIAIGFLLTKPNIQFNIFNIIIFSIGIWLGKMGVLWLYTFFSKAIVSKSGMLSKNINRIIAVIMFLTAIIQFIKI